MRSTKILTALVMVFALSGTPGVAASAVTLGQSHTLYFDKYAASKTGIIVDSGIVFSTVILPYGRDTSRNSAKAKAMISAWQQITEHYQLQALSSSTGSSSLDQALIRQRDIRLKKLPSRILVNRPEGESYRYVLAANEEDIKRLITASKNEDISTEDITTLLHQLDAGQHYHYLGKIFSEFGLQEIALQWEKKELLKKYCLANYYQPSQQPFLERQRLLALQADNSPALDWLCELPASAYVIDNHLKQKSLSETTILAFESTALPARAPNAIAQIKENQQKNPLAYLHKLPGQLNLASPYSAALSLPGHILFSNTFSDQPAQAFIDAKVLFEQGRELDTIISLLKESINSSPRHQESWQYLGAALIARQNWPEAAAVYLQWIALEPSNLEAISRYTESLHRMGLKQEASRFVSYLQLYAAINKFAYNTIQIIENKP
ncbi:hypothetical protein [Endozoicomonas sp. ALE010]|uniref:hypothetical protein n=1 Tax=Endozoicomonas sp. ALE010 TaxID=3403081 RepID=UPI003BB6F57E